MIDRHGAHRVGRALIDVLDLSAAATALARTVYASGPTRDQRIVTALAMTTGEPPCPGQDTIVPQRVAAKLLAVCWPNGLRRGRCLLRSEHPRLLDRPHPGSLAVLVRERREAYTPITTQL